ncbi:MAG: PEP/pyruvate-binding domain-containing protein [Anaerolineae bacterium]
MRGHSFVLWLDEVGLNDLPSVGGKAARLGEARRQGLPVPDGFCLTQAACRAFVPDGRPDYPQAGDVRDRLPGDLVQAIAQAQARLTGGKPLPLVVRSSASAEDLPDASFAGQQTTWLNVSDLEGLCRAIVACWESLGSPSAVAYRGHIGLPEAGVAMSVLVQHQIRCDASGVAFSQDPLGEPGVCLVEATWGMGEGVVSGRDQVDRFWLDRDTLVPCRPSQIGHKVRQWVPAEAGQAGLRGKPVPDHLQQAPALTPEQLQEVASLALAAEDLFGGPQDVEFGFQDGRLFLLQSRPVTAGYDPFFDAGPAGAGRLWTAGFVNERFQRPVSPLGWTLICPLLEDMAFRDPLRYLGIHDLDGQAILRLRRGHPYVDMRVFQHLYKVFPDWLLPEDAGRYFPGGDVGMKRQVPHPRGWWDPALWISLARTLLKEGSLCSPWHNHRRWMAFERSCAARLEELAGRRQGAAGLPEALWNLVEEAQALNRQLLAIHRWSLTLADVLYTLLRRACHRLAGKEEGARLAAAWVADVQTVSVQANQALADLARLCQQEGGAQALRGSGPAAAALEKFLKRYGHRSFSLDLSIPPFAEDLGQVEALVESLLRAAPAARKPEGREPRGVHQKKGPGWKEKLLRPLAEAARVYVRLREEQRFVWQQVLAFQRKAILDLSRSWAALGHLPDEGLVFFATWEELRSAVQRGARLPVARLQMRRQTFERLCRDEAALPPAVAYPPFLQGDAPLVRDGEGRETLSGTVVSPGLAQGRVCVVQEPADLGRVQPGDILVAAAVDPGWTPIFPNLAGLVLENGGQLSHGAVVAREYGLPALVGVRNATRLLAEGSRVLLDAHAGRVQRIG